MSTQLPVQDEFTVARQAAQWLEILKTAGDAERRAFAEWLRASHIHLREFLMMTALERELCGIDPQRQRNIQAILGDATGNVVALNAEESAAAAPARPDKRKPVSAHAGRSSRPASRLAAGVAMAALAGGWFTYSLFSGSTYSTAVGEQRSISLEDGSVVHLNTGSRVMVDFSSGSRELKLIAGEALFKVAPDAARPFRVHVSGSTIQALGTQFNVYRQQEQTRVAVLEGSVRVSSGDTRQTPQVLRAGQQTRIAGSGAIAAPAAADIALAAAWRQRRLAFRGDTLAEIATQFNRYNRSPRLQVEGEDIRALTFTANFEADDPESLLDFLSGYSGIVCERGDGVVVIRRAP